MVRTAKETGFIATPSGLPEASVPVFFHADQLGHQPQFEWISGEKILHPESSTRVEGILGALAAEAGVFRVCSPEPISDVVIQAVHSAELLEVYRSVEGLAEHVTVYPSVFPVGNDQCFVDPKNLWHAGAFCLDSGTPLHASTWTASCWSAACAYDGARLLAGKRNKLIYSLCRPPGHHASRDHFGGYCYLNNVAIAAQYLKQFGTVAIVDIDIHHGNGTQSIFYDSCEVFFASIHGDPVDHYPYFWGRESEVGNGSGRGYNLNVPLPKGTDGLRYLAAVRDRVLPAVKRFSPDFLLVSAGFDTASGDPLGTFSLVRDDFVELGKTLGRLGYPTLVVQEGGYDTSDLGSNVCGFLLGAQAALAQ